MAARCAGRNDVPRRRLLAHSACAAHYRHSLRCFVCRCAGVQDGAAPLHAHAARAARQAHGRVCRVCGAHSGGPCAGDQGLSGAPAQVRNVKTGTYKRPGVAAGAVMPRWCPSDTCVSAACQCCRLFGWWLARRLRRFYSALPPPPHCFAQPAAGVDRPCGFGVAAARGRGDAAAAGSFRLAAPSGGHSPGAAVQHRHRGGLGLELCLLQEDWQLVAGCAQM